MKEKLQLCVFLFFALFTLNTSCEKHGRLPDECPSHEVISAQELERVIIAGYDLKQTMNVFERDLKAINFSEIYEHKEQGLRVVRILSFDILIVKLNEFNESKKLLYNKYPELESLSIKELNDYMHSCMHKSRTVCNKLLDFGIDIYQPKSKSSFTESYNDYNNLGQFLAEWVNDPNYVEAAIYILANGQSIVDVYDDSTANESRFQYYSGSDGNIYYDEYASQQIVQVIHTHTGSQVPSSTDYKGYFGVPMAIYYSGSLYYYYD